MTASKAARLMAVLCGTLSAPVVLAHPGHQHNGGIVEGLLHLMESGWAVPLLLLPVLTVVAGYLYVRKAG